MLLYVIISTVLSIVLTIPAVIIRWVILKKPIRLLYSVPIGFIYGLALLAFAEVQEIKMNSTISGAVVFSFWILSWGINNRRDVNEKPAREVQLEQSGQKSDGPVEPQYVIHIKLYERLKQITVGLFDIVKRHKEVALIAVSIVSILIAVAAFFYAINDKGSSRNGMPVSPNSSNRSDKNVTAQQEIESLRAEAYMLSKEVEKLEKQVNTSKIQEEIIQNIQERYKPVDLISGITNPYPQNEALNQHNRNDALADLEQKQHDAWLDSVQRQVRTIEAQKAAREAEILRRLTAARASEDPEAALKSIVNDVNKITDPFLRKSTIETLNRYGMNMPVY